MAARGIDGNNIDQQVKACEDRGKELLKEYMDTKGDNRVVTRHEADEILAPLAGAFQLMENALNMSGKRTF